jgi:hypothetical protein
MSDKNQETTKSVHLTISSANINNPDGTSGSNVGAGSPADNPIQNAGKPAVVVKIGDVRFANPA